MSVATSTAIAIGMGAAAAGSSVAAAKIQSNAAKNAAKSQQAGTDKALQVQQETSAPYRQLGQMGVDRLTALGAPQPYTQQFRPGGGQPQGNGFQAFQPSGGPQGAPPTLGSIGMPQPPQGTPPGQQGGGMVRLQAPDGSISPRPFSMEEAQAVMAQARAKGHELRVVN